MNPVIVVSATIAPSDGVAEVPVEHATPGLEMETVAPATPTVEAVAVAEPEAVEPVAEPAPRPRHQRVRSAKATRRSGAEASGSTAAAMPAQKAPSRQSDRPSGEQFLTDLAAAGSFTALAEKYGKSTGTIGNWANQLREQGFSIPVGRQKKA